MSAGRPTLNRRRLAPEILQLSALDCGPAALASLLAGCGLARPLDELRDACRTGRDGTSIDDLEAVAVELGLAAEQILVPADYLAAPAAACTPCILVVRQPGGATHFVALWRCHGRLAQLMDPAAGRRWLSVATLERELYRHREVVPATAWRRWAESDGLLRPLGSRLHALGVPPAERRALTQTALGGQGWRPLAALDASARLTYQLAAAGGVRRGSDAARLLRALFEQALAGGACDGTLPPVIPNSCWSARPVPPAADGTEQVVCEGALLIRVRGLAAGTEMPGVRRRLAPRQPRYGAAPTPVASGARSGEPRMPSAASMVAALAVASTAAAVARLTEMALFAAAIEWLPALPSRRLRLGALGGLAGLGAALLLLELAAARAGLALGRLRETTLRVRLAAKLPRLPDRYLRTRLVSDLAERAHLLDEVRRGPAINAAGLRSGLEALLAAAGIAWLDPQLAPFALTGAAGALALSCLLLPRCEERNRRVRAHAAALGGLHLDLLRGLAVVRAHSAAASFRRRHDELLAGWVRARRAAAAAGIRLEIGTQGFLSLAAAGLVLSHVRHHGLQPRALLIVLWAFQLIAAAQRLAKLAGTDLPACRNLLRSLEEPLAATEERPPANSGVSRVSSRSRVSRPGSPGARQTCGVELRFAGCGVEVDGHWLLRHLDITLPAGQHVALLGASGAGKTTLLGTLLGWHRPASGRLWVDGWPLDTSRLAALRRVTAWAAPEVRLWNRTLLANLAVDQANQLFALQAADCKPVRRCSPTGLAPVEALRSALLLDLVPQLPAGMQTSLGEAGSRLSGGEAQRLRLARTLLRPGIRLALLDEPFRGLAADQRRRLLARARAHWRRATLLCVTHSPGEALTFDRVLILEDGAVREDGAPATLAADEASRFRALLTAAAAANAALRGSDWRHIHLADGRLHSLRTLQTPPSAPRSSTAASPPAGTGEPQ